MGKNKRGKGTKIMAVEDHAGLPIPIYLLSASSHGNALVEATIASRFTAGRPPRSIGDHAYDSSDPLDSKLRNEGIELIAPHRKNKVKPKMEDGRKLRRDKCHWKIERRIVGWQNFSCIGFEMSGNLDYPL